MNWPAFYKAELRTAEVLQKQSLAVYDDPDHAALTDLQTPWPLLGPRCSRDDIARPLAPVASIRSRCFSCFLDLADLAL